MSLEGITVVYKTTEASESTSSKHFGYSK